jgi:DNA-directed RNA polymerase specialized sigma24 family protein
MGAPLGTVKSWVNRGRSKLEEALEVRANSKIDESKT